MNVTETARLVFLNPSDRILLMQIVDPEPLDEAGGRKPPLWVTIGGRLEAGESVIEAARREAFEETGIQDLEVGPVVWYGEQRLVWGGRESFLKEHFVLVRAGHDRIDDRHWTEEERAVIAEMRWWSCQDLFETDEIVLPKVLPSKLEQLLREGAPGSIETILL